MSCHCFSDVNDCGLGLKRFGLGLKTVALASERLGLGQKVKAKSLVGLQKFPFNCRRIQFSELHFNIHVCYLLTMDKCDDYNNCI